MARRSSLLILAADDSRVIVLPDEAMSFSFERLDALSMKLEEDALSCTIEDDRLTVKLEKLS